MFGGNTFGGFGNNNQQQQQQQQQQQPSLFGQAKPNTFGSTTTGGFGSFAAPTNTGFNFNSNNQFQSQPQQPAFGQAAPAFGSGATQFGSNPTPAFGAQPTTQFGSNPTFGSGTTTGFQTSTFGQPQQQPGFGGGFQSGFSAATSTTVNNGTGNPAYQVTIERDGATSISGNSNFQSITAMPAYKNWSIEELKLQDYMMNKRFSGAAPAATTTTNSAFGQPASAQPAFGSTNSTFGASNPTTPFGSTTSAFGAAAQKPAFGAATTPSTGFGFGQTKSTFGNTGSAFGQKPPTGFGATNAFGSAAPAASTFGNTGASAFGSTGGFGTTPAQPAFGQPAANPAPAFGQPATTTNAFGQPAASSAFGQPAATTTFGNTAPAAGTGLFGQAAPAFGTSTQQSQQGGLFGAKPAATTGAFGTTQAPAFGTAAAAQPAGGLFGQKPATTGLFGSTQQPAQSAFGQPATGGLFGSTAPATQPQTGLGTSTFGAAPQQSTGLFGGAAKPATSLFGSTPGTGLFGSTAPAATTTQPLLFGSAPGAGTSLFGASTNQPQQILHASLDKNPYGVNPLLQKSVSKPPEQEAAPVIATPKKEKKLPTLTPGFKVTPRSASQIKLRGVAPPSNGPALAESYRNQIGSAPSKKSLHVLDGSPRDLVALGLDNRFTPRRSVKRLIIDDASVLLPTPSKPTPSSEKKSVSFDPVLEESCSALIEKHQVSTPAPRPTSVQFAASPNEKDVRYEMSPSLDDLLRMSDQELKAVKNFKISVSAFGSIEFQDPVDLLSVPRGRAGIQSIPENIVIIESQLVNVYPDESIKPPVGFGLNVPAVITLQGCWPKDKSTGEIVDNESDPRFDKHMRKLRKMPDTQFIGFEVISGAWKFRVEHFSRYGLMSDDEEDEEVVPEDSNDIIEDTFMKNDEVEYELVVEEEENDEEVLEEDEELEDEAEVDEMDLPEEYEEEEFETDDDGEFVEEPIISAEEEADQEVGDVVDSLQTSMNNIERLEMARKVQTLKSSLFSQAEVEPDAIVPVPTVAFDQKSVTRTPEKRALNDLSNNVTLTRAKFSKFPEETETQIGSPQKYIRSDQGTAPVIHVNLKTLVPFNESLIYEKQKLIADASHFMGRSFRCGWGPMNTLVQLNSKNGTYTEVSLKKIEYVTSTADERLKHEQFFECVLENADIMLTKSKSDNLEAASVSGRSEIMSSVFYPSLDQFTKCPKTTLHRSFSFEKVAKVVGKGEDFTKYESLVWNLCSALWDNLDLDAFRMAEEYSPEQMNLIEQACRKTKVSDWLKASVYVEVSEETKRYKSGIEKVFSLLTGRRIAEAVQAAIESKDFRLTTVIAQVGGAGSQVGLKTAKGNLIVPNGLPSRGGTDSESLADLASQIAKWTHSPKMRDCIDPNYIAVWSLLSGVVPNWDENVFKDSLGWTRVFGLFFWYSHGGSGSIGDALEQYSISFNALSKIKRPLRTNSDNIVFDIQYSLLQLSTNANLSLESILDYRSHVDYQLDCRVAWLLSQLFSAKNIKQFKDAREIKESNNVSFYQSTTLDRLTFDMIAQLESLSLWKWAIFVATVLPDQNARIKRILAQWYPVNCTKGSFYQPKIEDEIDQTDSEYDFLVDKLAIPPTWIHEAKALRARFNGDAILECICLIDAKQYNLAHDLLMSRLAGIRVISDDLKLLKLFLAAIPGSIVKNWKYGGEILLDYISIVETKGKETYDRQQLLSEVNALLAKLSGDLIVYPNLTRQEHLTLQRSIFHISSKLMAILRGLQKFDVTKIPRVNIDFDQRVQCCRQDALNLLLMA